MNNSAAKVGEIFREAGTAFNKLSEMTLMLQPMDDSPPGGKWSDAEVEMLRGCINRFAVELNKISQHIKNRTMRHLKSLLEMGSGTIQDISSSPAQQPQLLLQQPQEPQLLLQQPQDPQLLPQQLQPSPQLSDSAQEVNTLEIPSEFDLDEEAFVDAFSQVLSDSDNKYEDFDDSLWLHFDPSEVNPTPPANIMEEDTIRQQPSPDFEDFQDCTYDNTLQAIPSLISLLDADVDNATPDFECMNPTESSMSDIGTLHAVLPNYGSNLDEATGASGNFQGSVSREAHFSLRQAQDTWNHISLPATNHVNWPATNYVSSPATNHVNWPATNHVSSPATNHVNWPATNHVNWPATNHVNWPATNHVNWPATNHVNWPATNHVNWPAATHIIPIQYGERQHGYYIISTRVRVPSLYTDQPAITINIRFPEIQYRPQLNTFSSLLAGNEEARNNFQSEGNPHRNILCFFGSSSNNDSVGSVRPHANFSSILADTNVRPLPSNAHRTRRSKRRGRPRHRREGSITRAAPIITPIDASTAEPSQGRMTRSRYRQAYHCDEIEDPVPKKRSRKQDTTKATPDPRSRAEKKKQPPT